MTVIFGSVRVFRWDGWYLVFRAISIATSVFLPLTVVRVSQPGFPYASVVWGRLMLDCGPGRIGVTATVIQRALCREPDVVTLIVQFCQPIHLSHTGPTGEENRKGSATVAAVDRRKETHAGPASPRTLHETRKMTPNPFISLSISSLFLFTWIKRNSYFTAIRSTFDPSPSLTTKSDWTFPFFPFLKRKWVIPDWAFPTLPLRIRTRTNSVRRTAELVPRPTDDAYILTK